MKYAYYPGCSPKSTTSELDHITRKIAQELEMDLVELREASCCGTVEIRLRDPDLFFALNARTLAMAENQGLDVVTICATCQLNLAQSNKQLMENEEVLERTNKRLERIQLKYNGAIHVRHFLWVLLQDIGAPRLQEKITAPLSSLRVAPFYGCHILRPQEVLGFDDPDRPSSLDDLIRICGAEPVDYSGKTKCCGFHNLVYDQDTALSLTGRCLAEAREKAADCLVTPCPLCFTMLDGFQKRAEKPRRAKSRLPVLHVPQLLGLAMGMDREQLMFKKHFISPMDLFRKIGRG
jgi:succinate dehydrogenase / fumarate reductase cytochrome b subunit